MRLCASSSSASPAPGAASEEQRGEPFFLTTPLYYVRRQLRPETHALLCLRLAFSGQQRCLSPA